MVSVEGYRQDISEDIREKVQRLGEYERRIVELEIELNATKEESEALRASLRPYRVSNAPIASINRLPNELLHTIFESALLEEHYRIRTLLLVCQHWYNFVMDNPKLWARIVIPSAGDLFDLIAKKSLAPYIEACYRYSQNLPMDVDLNLDSFPESRNHMRQELVAVVKHIYAQASNRSSASRCKYDVTSMEEGGYSGPPFTYHAQVGQVLTPLIGSQGERLRRWESLIISFPNPYFSHIWTSVCEIAPHLKKFHVDSRRAVVSRGWWYKEGATPSFPSATLFSVPHSIFPSSYQLSPFLLQHLAIGVQDDYSNLAEISQISILAVVNPFRPSLAGGYNLPSSQHSFTALASTQIHFNWRPSNGTY